MDRKKEMKEYIDNFRDMPDRLLKYNEILLEGADATPECYQDTLSYRRIAVALTTRCNLNCKWCYRLDPQYKEILNKELDFDTYKNFVANTKGKFRMVHFGGLGEPTLYPKLMDIIKLSKNLSDKLKITTNCAAVKEEDILEYVSAGLTHIEISADAFEKDKLLEYRGVDIDNIHRIAKFIKEKTPLHLQINSVVSTKNCKDLIRIVDTFEDIPNLDVWHTIPLFETAQMISQNIKPLSIADYQELLLYVENEIKKKGLKWKVSPNAHGVRLDPVIEMKRRRNICFSCFEDPYISVTGRLNYCSRQEYSSVADISEGFEKSWNHPELLKFRKDMLNGKYPEYCGRLCVLKRKS
ncbi:MAG TPA: radical SAM protein [Candidatus Omnitrophota bacterium]|nr:radical SAM protein [Candidatus Omnitrophota bacterium]HPS19524.1 radical SAM protein [Candidatus Omnitrophota bacterium]